MESRAGGVFTVAIVVAFLVVMVSAEQTQACCPWGAYEAGVLLVGFEPGTTPAVVEAIVSAVGGLSATLRWDFPSGPIYEVEVVVGDERRLIPEFEAYSEVKFADTNDVICIPEDPLCSCCPYGLICPVAAPCLTLFESQAPDDIVTRSNDVGAAEMSPFEHTPPGAPVLFYQLDDGFGASPVLRMVADGPDLRIHF